MAEFVLCVAFSLITPVTMIACGVWFINFPPEEIGGIGYNTELSQKNADTWFTAHKICGKFWLIGGIAVMVSAFIVMAAELAMGIIGEENNFNILIYLVIFQTTVMLAVIPHTEMRLKKIFTPEGKRR